MKAPPKPPPLADDQQQEVRAALDSLPDPAAGTNPPGGGPDVPPPPPPDPQEIPPEQAARLAIEQTNKLFVAQGLKPMNPIQEMLIETGIVGCAKKYGIKFSLDNYPELALAGGVVWTAADKLGELRAKRKTAKPTTAAAAPGDGERDVTPDSAPPV